MLYLSFVFCRAIDIQALIGNIGGYIGLCLGYCFLQIPDLMQHCVGLIKKCHLHFLGKDSQTPVAGEAFRVEEEKNSNGTENQDNGTGISISDAEN